MNNILLYIIIFFPIDFIYGVVHECGHLLMASILGLKTCGVEVKFFTFQLGDTYACIYYYENIPILIDALVTIGGSLFCFIVGIMLLLVVWKKNLDKYSETALFMFGFFLLFDFLVYNITDIFFLQGGDWFRLYEITPLISGISLIVGILLLFIFIEYKHEINQRINFI